MLELGASGKVNFYLKYSVPFEVMLNAIKEIDSKTLRTIKGNSNIFVQPGQWVIKIKAPLTEVGKCSRVDWL